MRKSKIVLSEYCSRCGLEKHKEYKSEGCLNCENDRPLKTRKLRTYKFDEI